MTFWIFLGPLTTPNSIFFWVSLGPCMVIFERSFPGSFDTSWIFWVFVCHRKHCPYKAGVVSRHTPGPVLPEVSGLGCLDVAVEAELDLLVAGDADVPLGRGNDLALAAGALAEASREIHRDDSLRTRDLNVDVLHLHFSIVHCSNQDATNTISMES